MSARTEFYEVAVRAGFYGLDRASLLGKKDNVRKFWEDMSIKLLLRPLLEGMLEQRPRLRVIDLGCGAGEGFELLTHVPVRAHRDQAHRDFVLDGDAVDYTGVDLSPAMVAQGQHNYADRGNIHFAEADLSRGLPLAEQPPFDIYFSSYGSFSHLSHEALARLLVEIAQHANDGALVVVDLLGRFSPEWPVYWARSAREMLPYNMAYLLTAVDRAAGSYETFRNAFWSGGELRDLVRTVAAGAGRSVDVAVSSDRSMLVGRHIETGLFGAPAMPLRYEVNRLIDHGYRGRVDALRVELEPLRPYADTAPHAWARLSAYAENWNAVIELLKALMNGQDAQVRALIERTPAPLVDDMKMLAWLCRNGERFPVADYWSSVVGPQVAMVLRSIELDQPDAIGCGHGLFAVLKVGPKNAAAASSPAH